MRPIFESDPSPVYRAILQSPAVQLSRSLMLHTGPRAGREVTVQFKLVPWGMVGFLSPNPFRFSKEATFLFSEMFGGQST